MSVLRSRSREKFQLRTDGNDVLALQKQADRELQK